MLKFCWKESERTSTLASPSLHEYSRKSFQNLLIERSKLMRSSLPATFTLVLNLQTRLCASDYYSNKLQRKMFINQLHRPTVLVIVLPSLQRAFFKLTYFATTTSYSRKMWKNQLERPFLLAFSNLSLCHGVLTCRG